MMHFHHIGIAVPDIEASAKAHQLLGYSAGPTIVDEIQNVQLCFLRREDSPLLELVAPRDEKSPVNSILRKVRTTPYHTCYEVDDLEETVASLRKSKFVLVVRPVPAIAFGGRQIAFLYHNGTGLIELLQSENVKR